MAKSEAEKEEVVTIFPDSDDAFRIAKQMDHANQDGVGENCVHIDASELALTDKDKAKAWFEHYARLLNIEIEWPSNEFPEFPSIASLRWWPCAHYGHPGGVYLQDQYVEGWHGK